MPAAMQESEYLALNRKPANALPGKPTFDAILKAYADRRNKRDSVRQYYAVKMLLSAVATAESTDRPTEQQTLDRAASAVENDQRNFIARMLYATLIDERQRSANASAEDRLTAIDQVLSAPPTPKTATTYDDEYRELLADMFAATVPRADVAASLGAKWYEFYIADQKDWSIALPAIARSMNDLRQALDAAGNRVGAAKCRRWLAEFCLGLVENSGDESTQCLAAGILAASDSDDTAISTPMRGLVDAHTSGRIGHAADWASQFKSNGAQPQPSLAPDEYELAVERLLLYAIVMILAAGAAVAFVMGIASIVAPTDPLSPAPAARHSIWKSLLLLVAITGLTPFLLAIRNANLIDAGQAYYTPTLAFAVVHAAFFIILSLILIHAIVTAWPDRNMAFYIRRGLLPFVMFVAGAIWLALPSRFAAQVLRTVNYDFPQLGWSAVAMLIYIVVAVLVARVPARRLARSAASTWLVFAILACITMKLHVTADQDYQRAIVAAHADPMAARVGKDWKKTYVEPVKKSFTPPIP
ncbi:MAG: hypothetical protein H6818_20480 [Phycisphaerales bacterium]|nr:hypothetical protein [Phycisphaerales bacterium]MCB9864165.1 hypothetical protein [Phycisphaerales bacterium]